MGENSQIPNSWKQIPLGAICRIVNGYAFKSSEYSPINNIPLVRISDINDGRIILNECVKVKEDNKYEKFIVKKGDILIAMSGATTGKFGVFQGNDQVYQNQRVGKFDIFDKSKLLDRYLFYLLFSLKKTILDIAYGGAQPNISSNKIEQLKIPLPPLLEQKRIVAKIEELFSNLDKGIERLKAAQQQLKIYRQSVLKWAFEGRLVHTPNTKSRQNDWHWIQIKDIGKIETGTTPSKKKPEYYSKEYPFYKPSDLEAGNDVQSSIDRLSEIGLRKARYVPANAILVTCIGATIGKTGLIKKGGAFNQQLNAIIPNEKHNPKFIYYQTISPHFQEQIIKGASATTLPIINKKKFELLKMAICSIEQQQEIVSEIESRLSVCDKLEESIRQGLGQAEALRQSILKEAFDGKLVPRDPNNDSADHSLEQNTLVSRQFDIVG